MLDIRKYLSAIKNKFHNNGKFFLSQVFIGLVVSAISVILIYIFVPQALRSNPYTAIDCAIFQRNCDTGLKYLASRIELGGPAEAVSELLGRPKKIRPLGDNSFAIYASHGLTVAVSSTDLGAITEAAIMLGNDNSLISVDDNDDHRPPGVLLPDIEHLLKNATNPMRFRVAHTDNAAFSMHALEQRSNFLRRATIGNILGEMGAVWISRGICELRTNYGTGYCVTYRGIACEADGYNIELLDDDCATSTDPSIGHAFTTEEVKSYSKKLGHRFSFIDGFYDSKWKTPEGRHIQAKLYDEFFQRIVVSKILYGR